MSKPLGVVLAGGASLRMGQDKALLTMGSKSLLQCAVERFADLGLEVLVVGREVDAGVAKSLAEGLHWIPDLRPRLGPLGGLEAALRRADDEGVERIWIAPCDVPILPGEFYSWLDEDLGTESWRYAVVGGEPQVLVAVVRTGILGAVTGFLNQGQRSIQKFLQENSCVAVPEALVLAAGFGPELFANINTGKDYQRLLSGTGRKKEKPHD